MSNSQTEQNTQTFREDIAEFMNDYVLNLGFAEGFTSTLISESLLSTIENIVKNNKYEMLSNELTSSLHGLSEQVSLSQMNSIFKSIGKVVKLLPVASLANSLHSDWQNGNDYPYATMKSALTITIGIVIGGCCSGVLMPAIVAGIVGGIVDKHWDEIENKFKDFMGVQDTIQTSLNTAETVRSPLVLDLDGDGVETTSVENGTHFDHDGNDFAEKSGWVGSDDGLLVRDINGNGVIDDGTELFGNNSVLSSGQKAKNGFEALADLDTNNDGLFNSSDAEWNNVKVWKDANGNGIVDEGELLTLEQVGVAGINVDYKPSTTVDDNGNEHKQTGTFIKTDGSTASIHDVWFQTDTTDTVDLSNVEIPVDIAA